MEERFVFAMIFYRDDVDSIYPLANEFGLSSTGRVKVSYNDVFDEVVYDSYNDFLAADDDQSSIDEFGFIFNNKEPYEYYSESVSFKLYKTDRMPRLLVIKTAYPQSTTKFIDAKYVSCIIIHNLNELYMQGGTKKMEYLKRNGLLEDYLEFFEDYDYHYTKDLSIYEESKPGHSHNSPTYNFGSGWQMYYNTEEYYKVIPKPLWDAFTDCEENVVLENGLRKIILYKDQADFQNLKNRARQWAFRRQLGIDSIAHEICGGQDKEPLELPVVITKKNCIKGSTKVTRYLDANNNLVNPSKAVTKEIKEYLEDGITVVFEEIVTI